MHSFYLPPSGWREPFVLEGQEAHHLLKVIRARPGDTLRLFDGQGRAGVFILNEHDRNKAFLSPVDLSPALPRQPGAHLALGWNKMTRRNWLLEKSVELRAVSLVFWQAARSQGRVPEKPKEIWSEQCIAAAKQCGNTWLPDLETAPGGPGELIDKAAGFSHRVVLWENQEVRTMFDPGDLPETDDIFLVLGPEGGLTRDEVRLFKDAGFSTLSLGRNVLRWETAALLCLGLLYWQAEKKDRCKI
jgi:16S rRNA (uracil1498-N3)-methyltransferase